MANYDEFADRISSLLKQLDQIRVDLCGLISEMREYQSSYDKNDQIYLHRLEDVNANDIIETQRLVRDWQNARNGRRSVKDLISIVANYIDLIPYKNYLENAPILKGDKFEQR